MGIPDHLTCFLRNLYAGQEATVKTVMNNTLVQNWERNTSRMYYCHLSYLTSMQSTSCKMLGWMKHKLESKTAGRNINNLRYADDTTLMAESEEELKSCLMSMKEQSEKAVLKLKTKITASSPITSWQIEGGKMEAVTDFFS